MSLTLSAIRIAFKSARIKFFMNTAYIIGEKKISHLESRNQTFLGSGGRNESKPSHQLAGRNECNSHQDARIGEKKIFHELDVHNV